MSRADWSQTIQRRVRSGLRRRLSPRNNPTQPRFPTSPALHEESGSPGCDTWLFRPFGTQAPHPMLCTDPTVYSAPPLCTAQLHRTFARLCAPFPQQAPDYYPLHGGCYYSTCNPAETLQPEDFFSSRVVTQQGDATRDLVLQPLRAQWAL